MEKKPSGRKPTANPRNVRVTFLVTPAEYNLLQDAAALMYEGNVSIMTRAIVFAQIRRTELPQPAQVMNPVVVE